MRIEAKQLIRPVSAAIIALDAVFSLVDDVSSLRCLGFGFW